MTVLTRGRDGGGTASVPPPPPDPRFATLRAEELYAALSTSPRGLPPADARARLAHYGANELPRAARPGWWRRFAAQFTDLFAIVLIVASAITFLAYVLQRPRDVGTLELAMAILGVVVLNAVIGFTQEYSAERTAESLQAMVPHVCRVLRAGERQELPALELVPGDVVVLEAGDAVSADCRVVEAHEVAVNNAPLTGESDAVGRTDEPVAHGPLLHARNCVFMGTDVVGGLGKAVVFATGAATEFGRIFRLAAAAPRQKTPLQLQVASMARRVAGAALAIGAVMFAVRLPTGTAVRALFRLRARRDGGARAGGPAGDPVGVAGDRRAADGAPARADQAAAGGGGAGVDDGGVHRQDRHAHAGRDDRHPGLGCGITARGDRSGVRPGRRGQRRHGRCGNCSGRPACAATPGWCRRTARQGWRVLGDTTEGALLVAAAKAGLDLDEEEAAAPRVTEFPFDSDRKLMSTVHRASTGHHSYVKGAAHELLARCASIDVQR